MAVLEGLQPSEVFYYFEEISKIPHISYHEKALSDYCVGFARERGLFCQQDEMGNVLIVKEATAGYEQEQTIMIQGHLDMVGDKMPDCAIDMETEPIQLMVDGDYVCAKGTTLGGDDGIAIAYALAILDSEEIAHPRLEVIFTVSEEVGLLGAKSMDLSMCKGRRLINIDSDIEGMLIAGCAGGVRIKTEIPVVRVTKSGICCDIIIEGLKGGHSGMEIDKGRSNANVLMGRFLQMVREKMPVYLVSVKGGAKDNVIPKDSQAMLLVEESRLGELKEVQKQFLHEVASEFGTADPDIVLRINKGVSRQEAMLDETSVKRVLSALNLMPNGIQSMSMDLPGLVESSLNMGVIRTTEHEFILEFAVRSAFASAKQNICRKVLMLTELLGGSAKMEGEYPAWSYARNSRFRSLCVELYRQQYGTEPRVEIIHAGLECGLLSDKLPGLDCISMGPNMYDIHTPKERLSISSVARVWKYLKAILAAKED